MGLTKDADVWSGAIQKLPPFVGQFPAFKDEMSNCDAEAIQIDDDLSWESARFVIINIARDHGDRSHRFQLLDH